MSNLKKKMSEYQNKYGDIPLNYKERLDWMCDKYRLSVEDMDFILFEKERRMKRPRYRFTVNRKNLITSAITNPGYIHVYSPDAASNHQYMKRIVDEKELIQLNHLICTPCDVQ